MLLGFLHGKKLPMVGSFFLLFSVVPLFVFPATGLSEHDAQRICQWALFVVAGFHSFKLRYAVSWRWMVVVAAMLGFGLASGRWALIESVHLILLLALFSVWTTSLRERPESALPQVYAGVAVCYLVLMLPRWAAVIVEGLPFHPQEFYFGFSNQRFFGHWVTLSLPMVVLARDRLAALTRSPWVLDVAMGAWVSFALASGTRGTWIALALAIAVVAVCGKGGRAFALRLIRCIAIGSVAYTAMFVLLPWMTGSIQTALPGVGRALEGAHSSGRGTLWLFALDGIEARPWLGNGPMSYAITDDTYARHPHNLLLQIAYEWGIPLACAIAALIARMLLLQIRRAISQDGRDPLHLALLAVIVGGLAQAQVDGILIMPFSQVCFVLVCAMLCSLQLEQKLPAGNGLPGSHFYLSVGILSLAAAQLFLMWPELSRFLEWEAESLAATGVPMYQPRFWLQGVIFPGWD